MSKAFKKLIFTILSVTFIMSFSVMTYAQESSRSDVVITRASNTLHKVNGATTTNGALSYDSTITSTCYTIKAEGELLGNNSGGNLVTVYVCRKGSSTPVASCTMNLDGKMHTLNLMNGATRFTSGTYTIRVSPFFSGAYGLSTYFYN